MCLLSIHLHADVHLHATLRCAHSTTIQEGIGGLDTSSSILIGVAGYLDEHSDGDGQVSLDVRHHETLDFGQHSTVDQASVTGDVRSILRISGQDRGLGRVPTIEDVLPGELAHEG
ncbi:MAG TPA: hypothetical protein VGR19_11845 [Allosphingosinicella sp.]|nr:hypothetical protein [Allosphingosinicella sp.]